jgi:small subunit ribosomal protein S6
MPLYETTLIARQDMTPAAVDELSATLAQIIADGEGKVVKTDNWGLKTLAYRIQKNKKGYYVLMQIDAPSPAVLEMERQIRINEDVLRYMTLRVEEFEVAETKDEKEAA